MVDGHPLPLRSVGFIAPRAACGPAQRALKACLLWTDPVRHTPILGVHLYAMRPFVEGALTRGKSLKTLLILLLVWIVPAVVLFLYLMWTSQLLPPLRKLKLRAGECSVRPDEQVTPAAE